MISVIEAFIQAPIGNPIVMLTDRSVIKKESNNNSQRNQYRKNIRVGQRVKIIEKHNQGTNNYTIGKVNKILTNKKKHTQGIKVKLETGQVGRVQEILEENKNDS